MTVLNVLVVDDDRDFADSLAEFMQVRGHRVTAAHDTDEALATFRQQTFDVTFIDIMLPGLSGLDGLRAMRKLRPEAAVVLMTGANASQFASQAEHLGVRRILQKPFDPERVLRALEAPAEASER